MDTYYFARLGDRLVQMDAKNVVAAREAGMEILELVDKAHAERRKRPRRATDSSGDRSAHKPA